MNDDMPITTARAGLDTRLTVSPRKMRNDLVLSDKSNRIKKLNTVAGRALLLAITSSSAIVVLFIFYFIFRDGLPFFRLEGIREFVSSVRWYPSADPPEFGSLAIFVGTGLVTLGAIILAMPLGVAAAVCLSDILPFGVRQAVKPIIEMLAAIPSVAFGFFALVILAPYLQENGGHALAVANWLIGAPLGLLAAVILGDLLTAHLSQSIRKTFRIGITLVICAIFTYLINLSASHLSTLQITSGTNALNVSLILGIMALPTIVSISEDALQAVGRDLREGCYALGATRAETLLKVIIPAAASGILAAMILGIMRVLGETMVVWMASGNASQIPEPWFNLLEPVRTLTATIAGDMGEADHVTGSSRYHVLFAMAMALLSISFICNQASEWIMLRHRRKWGR